jgi:hypothetical protein
MSGNPYSKPNSWTGGAPGDAPSPFDNGGWAGPAEPNTVVPRSNDASTGSSPTSEWGDKSAQESANWFAIDPPIAPVNSAQSGDPVLQAEINDRTVPTTQGGPASGQAPITSELGNVLATWAGPGAGVAPEGTWYGGGAPVGANAESGVLRLVQAMATYSPDNRGFNSTPVGPAPSGSELNSALAANWH